MSIINLLIYILVAIGAFGLFALFYDNILGSTTGRSIFNFSGGKRKIK